MTLGSSPVMISLTAVRTELRQAISNNIVDVSSKHLAEFAANPL
jgi:hypothetical protein